MNLLESINLIGINNCMFLVPMTPLRTYFGFISFTSSKDEDVIVPCTIDESKYTVKGDYKITLKSIYPKFSKETYYVSDLCSLINEGVITMYSRVLLTN